MITVTRLNGEALVINANLIEFIERTPDTLITMTTGRKVMVRESVDEVVTRSIHYYRQIGRIPLALSEDAENVDSADA